jgi:hypothetical protein
VYHPYPAEERPQLDRDVPVRPPVNIPSFAFPLLGVPDRACGCHRLPQRSSTLSLSIGPEFNSMVGIHRCEAAVMKSELFKSKMKEYYGLSDLSLLMVDIWSAGV